MIQLNNFINRQKENLMKKIILFAFIIIAFTTSFLTADDTIMKNVAITADFNFPFFDEFNLKADIKIIPELSIGPNFDQQSN